MVERRRRFSVVILIALTVIGGALYESVQSQLVQPAPAPTPAITAGPEVKSSQTSASSTLETLAVKGRAPRTGYSREQFGSGWETVGACDVRNHILRRDLVEVKTVSEDDCSVLAGVLDDPYTAKGIQFMRGQDTSDDVQIDHVVALSDAWQKGAQQITAERREVFANDPLNLLAVDGPTNMKKGASDAASWLPPNKAYRCRYVARQIAVKAKYELWLTQAEKDAMNRVLTTCPNQSLPIVSE